MITATRGISGLTGGNCTKEEHDEYRRHTAEWLAKGGTPWDGTFAHETRTRTPGQTIAAEIQVALDELDVVMYEEGGSMHGNNQARLSTAFRILHSVHAHLMS